MSDDEPVFRTAAELREETETAARQPDFTIPEHPERRYPRGGGVEYEGGTVFVLTPGGEWSEPELASLVESVLAAENYRYGDWFDLPLPLYLVHDDATNDTFRVAVRDDHVELHVRPKTTSAGLRALYDRLVDATDQPWRVDRRA
ncbi:hypothetical protein [Halorarius litoreus]|uniref:hypothetical protein n=1 Tax=Halorarius litoreus TaxID=2962676 RepID=UPI0020CD6314|nr:hypothetical protein [Halorarius litoreus]